MDASFWWWLAVIGLLSFGLTAWRGAPWLPTRRQQAKEALRLLGLEPGQTVVDIGSGGGGFLLLAAKSGLRGVGYELNPLLWLYSKIRLWPYRHKVKVRLADYWKSTLPQCHGLYVFLIGHYMGKLDDKLTRELNSGTKVVSYIFELPRQAKEDSPDGLHLYEY